MNKHIKRLSVTALFTAVILVTTAFVKVPIGYGYIHIGDIFVLLAAYYLPPVYSFAAAVIGSACADLTSGFVIYIPATIIVKGLMSVTASIFYYKKFSPLRFFSASAIGGAIMILVYFVFECVYYGIAGAATNLPFAIIQPVVSIPLALLMLVAFRKVSYLDGLKAEMATDRRKPSDDDKKQGVK